MAKPSKYTPEIIETICEGLAEGTPLAQLCRQEGMPAYRTVWDWMQTMPEVSKAIACAREEGEEVIAANTRQIARGTSPESTKDVQRDKLIIENDLKLLAKWNPKKWSDRMALVGDAESPIKMDTTIQIELVRPRENPDT